MLWIWVYRSWWNFPLLLILSHRKYSIIIKIIIIISINQRLVVSHPAARSGLSLYTEEIISCILSSNFLNILWKLASSSFTFIFSTMMINKGDSWDKTSFFYSSAHVMPIWLIARTAASASCATIGCCSAAASWVTAALVSTTTTCSTGFVTLC